MSEPSDLTITFRDPDAEPGDDALTVAREYAAMLNETRATNGGPGGAVEVVGAAWGASVLDRIIVVGRDLPDVPECFGHKELTESCPQCDGSHRHQWRRCLVVQGDSFDIARRCLVCGGRACDVACIERRHHAGPHIAPNGRVRMVGK